MTEDDAISNDKKFCACGICGVLISRFDKQGRPRRFVRGHYWMRKGSTIHKQRYIQIRDSNNPRASKHGKYVFEHISKMEEHLGRYLKPNEIVHHIDENRQNNYLSNLIITTRGGHNTIHKLGKHKNTSDRVCFNCKSNKTYIRYPSKSNKEQTPCPVWCHLPWDKVNWYCHKCYKKLVKIK